jgi:hypothetical protein
MRTDRPECRNPRMLLDLERICSSSYTIFDDDDDNEEEGPMSVHATKQTTDRLAYGSEASRPNLQLPRNTGSSQTGHFGLCQCMYHTHTYVWQQVEPTRFLRRFPTNNVFAAKGTVRYEAPVLFEPSDVVSSVEREVMADSSFPPNK